MTTDLDLVHTHPFTGEIIRCKICENGATSFLSGLFPLCPKHSTRVMEIHANDSSLTVHDSLRLMRIEEGQEC